MEDSKESLIVPLTAQQPRQSIWSMVVHSLPILLLCVALVAFSSAQRVSFKLLGFCMGDYSYVVLLIISFVFVPIFFILTWIIILKTGGFEPQTTTARFKLHFGAIGVCNGLNGLLLVFANPYVAGTMQAMFLQFAVPFTMFFSVVFLKLRYKIGHYIGVLIILCGLCVELIPTLIGMGNSSATSPGWCVCFIASQLPLAFGAVYQQKAFSKGKVNVVYLMAWASLAQFVFVLLALPLTLTPRFGNIVVSEFSHDMTRAFGCAVGDRNVQPECANSPQMLVLCILTMLLSNVFQALVVKYGSASLCAIVQTLVTPVSTISFTIEFIMRSYTESMSPLTWVALAALMLGIGIYRYFDIQSVQSESKEAEGMSINKGEMECGNSDGDVNLEAKQLPPTQPKLISTGIGIINSEYTNDEHRNISILYEHTLLTSSTFDHNNHNHNHTKFIHKWKTNSY